MPIACRPGCAGTLTALAVLIWQSSPRPISTLLPSVYASGTGVQELGMHQVKGSEVWCSGSPLIEDSDGKRGEVGIRVAGEDLIGWPHEVARYVVSRCSSALLGPLQVCLIQPVLW